MFKRVKGILIQLRLIGLTRIKMFMVYGYNGSGGLRLRAW